MKCSSGECTDNIIIGTTGKMLVTVTGIPKQSKERECCETRRRIVQDVINVRWKIPGLRWKLQTDVEP